MADVSTGASVSAGGMLFGHFSATYALSWTVSVWSLIRVPCGLGYYIISAVFVDTV